MSKVGSTASGRRVYVLDGYAGPGTYDDGSPGSPSLIARTALEMAQRDLRGIYVEQNSDACKKLQEVLGATGTFPDIREGPIEDHLDSILELVEGSPLLAFFDPFGLGIPFEMLTGQVLERATGPRRTPTEVLLNLSVPGIERNAGHVKEPTTEHKPYYKARETILARMDASLGGDWWREIWSDGAKGAIDKIVEGYWDRLKAAAGGWGSWIVPVSDRWGGPPSYYLIFLSKHPDGLWAFSEALSLAHEEHFDFCHRDQLPLETKADRWARWTATIAGNIEEILAEGKAFRVRDRAKDVFGELLGEARERHIRAAIKQLYKEGKTSTPGRGDIPSMVIVPGPEARSTNSLAG